MVELRFDSSVWCNVEVALRNTAAIYNREIEPLGLAIIEWYVLRLLYEQDGQMPSHLAERVGRPATSFTPILDQIENKGLIERRPHPADRRAVKIYLTAEGKALESQVTASVQHIECKIRQLSSDKDWRAYEHVVANLQTMAP